jgi:DNA polymerase III subunit beta
MNYGVPVTLAFGADGDRAEAGAGRARPARGSGDDYQPHPAEGLISFEVAQRRLTARLIGGEFIRYRGRFAGEFGCHADLLPGPVIEAVRRAALVAERAGPVRLTFGEGHLVIEAHAEGRARAAETVAADFTGDQPTISFNPAYLLDGLVAAAAMAGQAPAEDAGDGQAAPGRIRLDFNTPAKPALITWIGAAAGSGPGRGASDDVKAPEFRYLLVPLRLPERA